MIKLEKLRKFRQLLALMAIAFFLIPGPALAGSEEREVYSYIKSLKGAKSAARYAPLIVQSAHRYGLNPMLIASVIRVESDFNQYEVSSAGARGLMQVMPFHFEYRNVPRSRWFDPRTNIDLGCHIYSYYQKMMAARYRGLSSQSLAHRTLVAFNMGPGAVTSRGIYRSRYSQVILNYYRQSKEHR